jgi:exopolysaccharide production protein ExoY
MVDTSSVRASNAPADERRRAASRNLLRDRVHRHWSWADMSNSADLEHFDVTTIAGPTVLHGQTGFDLYVGAKRVVDVVLTLISLIALAPLMLVLWCYCRVDGGPACFGHVRVGRYGREFRCRKFRTMVVDAEAVLARHLAENAPARAEWEANRKLTADPRVTRMGRLLRASSFDELPQLFNVLQGDMSLVGPRPVVRAELAQFYGSRGAAAYLSVRPGVTGLWQVSGRSDVDYARRVALDTDYVRNASLWLDARILCRTVKVVLLRQGAR